VSTSHIRILPELRAVQVERSYSMWPCLNFYFDVKYDLGATQVPENFRRVSIWSAAKALLTADAEVLEVPEPLWLRFLPRNAVLLAAWRAGGIVRRRRRYVVTYAIENNDLSSLLTGRRRPPRLVTVVVARVLGLFVSAAFDRIAFGSEGARSSYDALKLSSGVSVNVVPELPSTAEAPDQSLLDVAAIYVGRLERRKGIETLMLAWPDVERAIPAAKLTVVGDGPLESNVLRWSEERPASRRVLGFVEHRDVGALVAQHRIAVAPSIREGRWREQIGLPIVEALSRGLTIVTTNETGLADWLSSHGHRVIHSECDSSALSNAMIDALMAPLERSEAQAALPDIPGRISADRWMHSIAVAP
jgi:glycosyltransferase involved in cell wall biosynthesis